MKRLADFETFKAGNLGLNSLLLQVAGQIARTAAIFNIDEVVVIDDAPNAGPGRSCHRSRPVRRLTVIVHAE